VRKVAVVAFLESEASIAACDIELSSGERGCVVFCLPQRPLLTGLVRLNPKIRAIRLVETGAFEIAGGDRK
jgi:hypothetical protein